MRIKLDSIISIVFAYHHQHEELSPDTRQILAALIISIWFAIFSSIQPLVNSVNELKIKLL